MLLNAVFTLHHIFALVSPTIKEGETKKLNKK